MPACANEQLHHRDKAARRPQLLDVALSDGPRWLSPDTPPDAGWLPSFHCSHVLAGTWVPKKGRAGIHMQIDGSCTRVGVNERSRVADTCAGRLEHTTTRAYAAGAGGRSISAGFVANERFLPGSNQGSVCAEQFVNLVMLREPIARIFSTWSFMRQYRRPDATGRWPSSAAQRIALSPVVADNFYVRLLLGRHGWSLPLNGVGESHYTEVCASDTTLEQREKGLWRPRALPDCLHPTAASPNRPYDRRPYPVSAPRVRSQAVRRLRQFDLVLVLETVAECEAAMRLTLGWTVTRLPHKNVAHHVANDSAVPRQRGGHLGNRSAGLLVSEEAMLRTQNKWDLALYQEAQTLASASCAALERVANDQSDAVREAIAAYHSARHAACDPHSRVTPATATTRHAPRSN